MDDAPDVPGLVAVVEYRLVSGERVVRQGTHPSLLGKHGLTVSLNLTGWQLD